MAGAGIGRPVTRYRRPLTVGYRKRQAHAAGNRSQQAIGHPEVTVGLHQHKRYAPEHGRQAHRTGDVTAGPEHGMRVQAP